MASVLNFLRKWKGAFDVLRYPRDNKRIVFYAEDGTYWPYFEPIVTSLVEDHGQNILYVTSDPNDLLLRDPMQGMRVFYVGWGASQITFFETLKADVVVMTTPDLNRFHMKKSPHVGCYAYLHHSVVSSHMVYREGAFDHFDAIFCVGPHHAMETRAWEKARNLPEKQLIQHGYGLIDKLAETAGNKRSARREGKSHILVAPSWGENGLLETHGEALCRSLLEAGFAVTVRPHPRTDKLRPDIRKKLTAVFCGNPEFRFDGAIAMRDSLIASDLMISDWSGVAFEYAFGLLRPVLFVDVPRKINNPAYEEIDIVPLEVSAREKIGRIANPSRLEETGRIARTMIDEAETWRERLAAEREEAVYNFSHSGRAGAHAVFELKCRLMEKQ